MTVQSRFASKCGLADENGCVPWIGNKLPTGYGQLRVKKDGKWVQGYAHRVAWILANGEIPEGASVLHHCDNPSCVNPAHLFLGSQKDNMRDKSAKGRHHMRRGRPGLNAVDDERMMDLRKAGCTVEQIADWIGTSAATVSFVTRGLLQHPQTA